jgi:hypothetical protein
LLRGFQVLAKSVLEGAKFRNTPSACGGDRNFEDFASLFLASLYTVHDISWRVNTGLMRMMLPAFILLWLGGMGLLSIFLNSSRLSTSKHRE